MSGRGFTVKKDWDNPVEHAMPAEARVPAEVRLGAVVVRPATVLAPMAGVTDTVFRRFIRHASLFTREQGSGDQGSESRSGTVKRLESEIDAAISNAQSGCGLMMTEFTSADGLARMRETKRRRYLTFYDDEHPIGAQLFGSNAETLAEAARIVEETGFDTVDLNLGCPAKRVVGCNGGSGLLRDLPKIGEIFRAIRKAVTIPFTVKFRMGWNDAQIVCVELARMAESEGLNARGAACADARAGLQRPGAVAVDCRGEAGGEDSGDRQRRRSHAGRRGGDGGRDGLRCGDDRPRGAGESVDLPADCAVHGDGQLRACRRVEDRYRMIRAYFEMLLAEAEATKDLPRDARMGDPVGKMKQFATWFTHGVPGGAKLRAAIYQARTGADVLAEVERFFATQAEAKAPGEIALEDAAFAFPEAAAVCD